jgi:two-component system, LytTR family, sensor kinase
MDKTVNHHIGLNWVFKYKLHHLPFWLAYNFGWWAVQWPHPMHIFVDAFCSPYAIKFFFYVIFQGLAVYVNLYYLLPTYLEKGRLVTYIALVILTIGCAAALIVPGYYLTAVAAGKTLSQLFGIDHFDFWKIFLANPLASVTAASTLAMSIKLAKNWMQTKRRQQRLEQEKLETELNFLRYQFNPHFLFNTINSIFFLIHKNPHGASDALAKFSDLLRYQLYECNETQIALSKEIDCLVKSIELQKLRQNENMEVNVEIDRLQTWHWGIAPFILMTFVENAFKHVSKHTDKSNWIRIKLAMNGQQLQFSVFNSTSHSVFKEVIHYSGIGLKNVQRRLDLIYPDRYELDIQSQQASFEVRLLLGLSEWTALPSVRQMA